jgi:hypothetical protein
MNKPRLLKQPGFSSLRLRERILSNPGIPEHTREDAHSPRTVFVQIGRSLGGHFKTGLGAAHRFSSAPRAVMARGLIHFSRPQKNRVAMEAEKGL